MITLLQGLSHPGNLQNRCQKQTCANKLVWRLSVARVDMNLTASLDRGCSMSLPTLDDLLFSRFPSVFALIGSAASNVPFWVLPPGVLLLSLQAMRTTGVYLCPVLSNFELVADDF